MLPLAHDIAGLAAVTRVGLKVDGDTDAERAVFSFSTDVVPAATVKSTRSRDVSIYVRKISTLFDALFIMIYGCQNHASHILSILTHGHNFIGIPIRRISDRPIYPLGR